MTLPVDGLVDEDEDEVVWNRGRWSSFYVFMLFTAVLTGSPPERIHFEHRPVLVHSLPRTFSITVMPRQRCCSFATITITISA